LPVSPNLVPAGKATRPQRVVYLERFAPFRSKSAGEGN
jgi:hypothetical protein